MIADFSEKIANWDSKMDKDTLQFDEIRKTVETFNKGDLFSAATAKRSFQQMSEGDAITENVESVTGDELGTNSLLKVKKLDFNDSGGAAIKDSDFVMKKEDQGNEKENEQ